MLFIRSISYCLEQIQAYFNSQLSCFDYETHLAQKFSYKSETKITAKLPSELLKEAPVHRRSSEPETIVDPLATQFAAIHLNTSTSPVMGVASLQVRNNEEQGSEEKAQDVRELAGEDVRQEHQSKPLLVASSHQARNELEYDWTNIPLAGVGIIKERGFYQKNLQVFASVDDMPLRFGVTWRQIVNSTYDDCMSILDNNLKQESLTDVKMLVLARYARQLQIIKAWGTKILDARDQYLKVLALGSHSTDQKENILSVERERQRFLDQSVDEWLIQLTSIAKEEAILLFSHALTSHKVRVGFGFEFSHSAGDSEDMVNACDHTIMQFFHCMKTHDARKESVRIQDLFPSQLHAPDAIIMSFMSLTHYLSQNWFTEGMFLAHKQRGTYLNTDQYTFDPEKTEAKRRSVLDLMAKLEAQLPALFQVPNTYWETALTLVDKAATDSAYLTTSKGYFASYLKNSDRLPMTYQALHTQFVEQADRKTDNVVSKHRSCKFQ
ncbi:hypothetical protein CC99x_011635 [Candidatus Berkiella cookevillensis]|uniref:Uncharacterized protein n=1 Tax=Candidatus Berkiella cookevillensis TaxID=437022 RepID=A0A0Q9YNL2_9GAMM|nr:hypothetical protein [Candidatus Berkiella cookevillensis]MCS5709547.1 hypothetical protein [Candidatus Berkiella cookevillensis]